MAKRTPRPRSRFRRLLRALALRLVVLVIATTLALLVGELIVRIVMPQQLIVLRPDVYEPVHGLGWVHRPDLDTIVNTGERDVHLYTDAHGHRVGAPGARALPAAKRVLLVGDSFLAALQVPYEQTFGARLAERLSKGEGAPVATTNTGVGAWGPSQYRLKIAEQLARPDAAYDAIAVFLYLGNDVSTFRTEAFEPRPSRKRPFRWPDELSRDAVIDAWLYPLNELLEKHSHLFVLARNSLQPLLMRFGLSRRHIHWVFQREAEASDAWSITADQCAEMRDLAKARGVPIRFFLLPPLLSAYPEVAERYAQLLGVAQDAYDLDQPGRLLGGEMTRRGLAVHDLTGPLRAAARERKDRRLFGRIDRHLSPAGHEAVADAVSPLVRQDLDGLVPR